MTTEISSEKVIILPFLGIQLETHFFFYTATHFISHKEYVDVFLNETIDCCRIRLKLVLMTLQGDRVLIDVFPVRLF